MDATDSARTLPIDRLRTNLCIRTYIHCAYGTLRTVHCAYSNLRTVWVPTHTCPFMIHRWGVRCACLWLSRYRMREGCPPLAWGGRAVTHHEYDAPGYTRDRNTTG